MDDEVIRIDVYHADKTSEFNNNNSNNTVKSVSKSTLLGVAHCRLKDIYNTYRGHEYHSLPIVLLPTIENNITNSDSQGHSEQLHSVIHIRCMSQRSVLLSSRARW
jgi:hypothetical protein